LPILQKTQCWLWRKRKRATGPASAPKLRQNRIKYSATADVAPRALCATQWRVEQIQRVVALRIIAGAGGGGMNPQVLSSPDLAAGRQQDAANAELYHQPFLG